MNTNWRDKHICWFDIFYWIKGNISINRSNLHCSFPSSKNDSQFRCFANLPDQPVISKGKWIPPQESFRTVQIELSAFHEEVRYRTNQKLLKKWILPSKIINRSSTRHGMFLKYNGQNFIEFLSSPH